MTGGSIFSNLCGIVACESNTLYLILFFLPGPLIFFCKKPSLIFWSKVVLRVKKIITTDNDILVMYRTRHHKLPAFIHIVYK